MGIASKALRNDSFKYGQFHKALLWEIKIDAEDGKHQQHRPGNINPGPAGAVFLAVFIGKRAKGEARNFMVIGRSGRIAHCKHDDNAD